MARILTGIQSSGKPHLGNILGAIKPSVQLSKDSDNQSLFFIADLHSLIKKHKDIFEKRDVGFVDEQVGTHVDEARLAGGVAPRVNAGADALGSRLGKNRFGGFEKRGIVVLLRLAKVARQVVRPD